MFSFTAVLFSIVAGAIPGVFLTEVKVDRLYNTAGKNFVRNSMLVEIDQDAWNKSLFRISPFRCDRAYKTELPTYEFNADESNPESVILTAETLYEISGNNGYVEFDIYLCAYNVVEKTFKSSLLIGEGEYFDND